MFCIHGFCCYVYIYILLGMVKETVGKYIWNYGLNWYKLYKCKMPNFHYIVIRNWVFDLGRGWQIKTLLVPACCTVDADKAFDSMLIQTLTSSPFILLPPLNTGRWCTFKGHHLSLLGGLCRSLGYWSAGHSPALLLQSQLFDSLALAH